MAIDKNLLLGMLMNSAPLLMEALRKPYNNPMSMYDRYTNLDIYKNELQDLHSRGYDMGLIQDDMLSNLKTVPKDVNMDVNASAYALSDVIDHAQAASNLSNSLNRFPSYSIRDSIDPSHFYDKDSMLDYMTGFIKKIPAPTQALNAAFWMLSRNPNIGK